MEETKNLMDKTADELTVRDTLILTAVAPILVIGSAVVTGAAFSGASKVAEKVREFKANRRLKKTETEN